MSALLRCEASEKRWPIEPVWLENESMQANRSLESPPCPHFPIKWYGLCPQGVRKTSCTCIGETFMSGRNKLVAELIRGLKHERDELKVQMHLGSKEIQSQWRGLCDRLEKLESDYEPAKDAATQSAGDVFDALRLVGEEIRDGFTRIRKAL